MSLFLLSTTAALVRPKRREKADVSYDHITNRVVAFGDDPFLLTACEEPDAVADFSFRDQRIRLSVPEAEILLHSLKHTGAFGDTGLTPLGFALPEGLVTTRGTETLPEHSLERVVSQWHVSLVLGVADRRVVVLDMDAAWIVRDFLLREVLVTKALQSSLAKEEEDSAV